MTVHEYGAGEKIIVLVHPTVVMWDYFDYIVPLLEGQILSRLLLTEYG